jgi:hypothetical protein
VPSSTNEPEPRSDAEREARCAIWDIARGHACARLILRGAQDVHADRDDRVLRAMIVRNEVPPAVVEWVER